MLSSSNVGKRVQFCVVSDIHCRVKSLKRIYMYLRDRKYLENIDVVLCLGDIADVQDTDLDSVEALAAAEGDVSDAISTLESITARVVYLPGNHDPPALFGLRDPNDPNGKKDGENGDEKLAYPRLTSLSKNLHLGSIELVTGLHAVGLGGSVPAYAAKAPETVHWPGFPYDSHEAMADDVEALRGMVDSITSDGDQVLVLTHSPPEAMPTSEGVVSTDPANAVECGSRPIKDMIREESFQKLAKDGSVLGLMHGHAHHAWGIARVGAVNVLNPGPARDGMFVILTLESIAGRWRIAAQEFHSLPEGVREKLL